MVRQFKDSGIEWIGKIPETWGTCKVSQLYNVQLGKMLQPNQITDTDTYENYLCAANVGQNALKFFPLRQMWIQKKERDIYSLSKGDLIVVEGGDVASCDIIKDTVNNLFFQNALHRVRAKNGYTVDYLRYVLMTAKAVGYIDLICNKATISHFTKEKFENLVIPISHISEQQRIVDNLDKKCGEIDSLIRLQEKMIDKLKAYKQSVITEAVTKGLDPNARFIPSGIDWIGDIPEGWKITVLRRFTKIILGKMLQPNAKSENDSIEQYICAKDVHFEGIDTSDLKKMYFNKTEKGIYQVQKGDMLVVEGGAGAAGSCVLKTDLPDTYIQNSIMIVRPKQGIDIRYVQYFEFSLVKKGYVDYVCNKATIPHFTKDKLSSMPIPLPSLSEQQTIASYLDEKCSEIDKLIVVKQKKIEKLTDYKKSIIYEAVTGKTNLQDS